MGSQRVEHERLRDFTFIFHIYISFQILSLVGYYKILHVFPFAIQQVLAGYLFHIYNSVYMLISTS